MLAGILLNGGFAPYSYTPLLVLCPAFLAWKLHQGSARTRIRKATCFFGAFFSSGAYWIYISIHVHGHAAVPLALGLTLLFIATLTAAAAPWMGLLPTSKRPLVYALHFAGLWLAGEYLRSILASGFPWLCLSYGHTDSPLHPFIPLLGRNGLSWLSAFISAILIFPRAPMLYRSGALIGALTVYLHWQGPFVHPLESHTQVALIQGNVPQTTRWQEAITQLARYDRLIRDNPDADLILIPEMAVEIPLPESGKAMLAWDARAAANKQSLIVGIPLRKGSRYQNGLIGLGEASGQYAKQHLIPFGEFLPFEAQLRGLIEFFALPMSDFIKGTEASHLYSPHGQITPIICYEIAFPAVWRHSAQSSDFLVSVGNYAWFGDSIAPHQEWQIARFFAKAAGKPLIQAANTGLTGIIDAHGHTQAQLPSFIEGGLEAPLPRFSGTTPWLRWGEGPGVVWVLLASIWAVAQRRSKKF